MPTISQMIFKERASEVPRWICDMCGHVIPTKHMCYSYHLTTDRIPGPPRYAHRGCLPPEVWDMAMETEEA